MCGGGNNKQNQAAQGQLDLSNTLSGIFKENQALTNPFYASLLKNGLPFMGALTDYSGGTTARAFAPARAELAQRLSRMNNAGLPSGFATQANTDLDTSQARAFDSNMVQNLLLNQQAKEQGAGGLNPLSFGTAAQSGYGNILQMPQKPSLGGSILGGALGGLAGGI